MGIHQLYHPEVFQGSHKQHDYFEGWYYKMVSPPDGTGQHDVVAVIPGVSFDDTGKSTAFVQVLDSRSSSSWFVPYQDFSASSDELRVTIGRNQFTAEQVTLDVEAEGLELRGDVRIIGRTPFPVSLCSPGIMGWYSFIPAMECFHGVVSMTHHLEGALTLNGRSITMQGGSGYIEKDWGSSFPAAWIWMQSNTFSTPGDSCMVSVARIPWIRRSFTGFLGFLRYQGHVVRFGTYTGARITSLTVDDLHAAVTMQLPRIGTLTIAGSLSGKGSGRLVAPQKGTMVRDIIESVSGRLQVTLTDRSGRTLFEDTGICAGIELSEGRSLKGHNRQEPPG